MFADFEMQNLYKQKNSKYENLISLIDHAPLELKLRINLETLLQYLNLLKS